ncbi:hypothetical protein [Dyella humicola]|uniref:hypothetical protein n=1 Tax=Dyella humicola TaxID=2992126 RepID=UPI00225881D4|nr:hypothetical protein [Dyella humicola]
MKAIPEGAIAGTDAPSHSAGKFSAADRLSVAFAAMAGLLVLVGLIVRIVQR